MGNSNFYIKNNRLRRFYENADGFADEDFTGQERKEDDLIESARLSTDFPKQAVESLSKIAKDKDFPLQEMSDKEILSLGVFLHNIGNLFFYEKVSEEPQEEVHEEIADMDDSALKSFYKEILDDYKLIKDEEDRKSVTEFIYNIIHKNRCLIIQSGVYEIVRGRGIVKVLDKSLKDEIKNSLKDYIPNNTRDTTTKDGQLVNTFYNSTGTCLPGRDRSRFNKDDFPKRAVFAQFYNNL